MAGAEIQKLQEEMQKVIAELRDQKDLQAKHSKDMEEQKEKHETITQAQAVEIESLKEIIKAPWGGDAGVLALQ